jgi:hypothetical protein
MPPEKVKELVKMSKMSDDERRNYMAEKENKRKASLTPSQRKAEEKRNKEEIKGLSGGKTADMRITDKDARANYTPN